MKSDGLNMTDGSTIEYKRKRKSGNGLNIHNFQLVHYGNKENRNFFHLHIPNFEVSTKMTKKGAIDIFWYEVHYCFLEKMLVFPGNDKITHVFGSCLSEYEEQGILKKIKLLLLANPSCIVSFLTQMETEQKFFQKVASNFKVYPSLECFNGFQTRTL